MDKIQTGCSYFVIFVSLFLPRLPFQVFNLSGYFLFIVSNFCLDCLFRFSIHRDAHFCLSRPFRVFDLPSCSFVFLDKVFLDCVSIYRMREFIAVHGCESHSTAREASFDDVWAFVIRSPFAPRIWLKRQNLFKHEVAFPEFTRSDLFVESFLHSSLIELSMTQSGQALFFNQVQLVVSALTPVGLR